MRQRGEGAHATSRVAVGRARVLRVPAGSGALAFNNHAADREGVRRPIVQPMSHGSGYWWPGAPSLNKSIRRRRRRTLQTILRVIERF